MPHTGPPTTLVRESMSYASYLGLPESIRAEWVDGEAVMAPSPSYVHQQAARRVANLLEAALPTLHVVEAVTVQLSNTLERVPDVSVLADVPQQDRITEVPLIVVEVLSPATRGEDTTRKSEEYLAAGIAQYWLVDPTERTIDVLANAEDRWERVAHLHGGAPRTTIDVTEHGAVTVELDALRWEP